MPERSKEKKKEEDKEENWRTNFFLPKVGRNVIDRSNSSQQQQPHSARRSSRMQPSLRIIVYDKTASNDPADFRPLTPDDFLNRGNTPFRAHPSATLRRTYLERDTDTCNVYSDPKPNFAVGDVVFEIDSFLRRRQLNLGRVTKTYPGADGLVRIVDVQYERGLFRRGIGRLALLETGSSAGSP
ncbi:hypothetical protein OUZ56_025523 [Daphnia magna]|uniref:DUF5641 domain-containing protein n=1 Tax=Daphnia magna TaxID=35525 RepID=A0ABQ9ZK43_9CRUS|nr:hypothetical protein OUZ56_025523 [Daphnia magna]